MLTFLTISLISRGISSCSDQMKSALTQLDATETTEAYAEVVRDFEEISENPDEWLSKYFVAACYIFITPTQMGNRYLAKLLDKCGQS